MSGLPEGRSGRLHGHDARLQLGRTLNRSLTAHASPQHDGSPVIPPDDAAAIVAQINPEQPRFALPAPSESVARRQSCLPPLWRGAPSHKLKLFGTDGDVWDAAHAKMVDGLAAIGIVTAPDAPKSAIFDGSFVQAAN